MRVYNARRENLNTCLRSRVQATKQCFLTRPLGDASIGRAIGGADGTQVAGGLSEPTQLDTLIQ